jgi:hypothetical protein
MIHCRPPNGLELSCPAEAGRRSLIVAHASGPGTPPYAPARRVSFSELLGSLATHDREELSLASVQGSTHGTVPLGVLCRPRQALENAVAVGQGKESAQANEAPAHHVHRAAKLSS